MDNVIFLDMTYIKYKKMWQEDRWKFSGEMVKLTIKQSRSELTDIEKHNILCMNRVVEENNGEWLKETVKKIRKKG
jgi:hypothetical protein